MTKSKNGYGGFTLIELLVVIAIVGLLASIVLASLSRTKGNGNDAKTQQQMSGIRTAAGLAISATGSYGTATVANDCNGLITNSGLVPLMTASNWIPAVSPVCTSNASAGGNITQWAMSHTMTSATDFWCVDSYGSSLKTTSAVVSGKRCDGVTNL